MALAIIIDWFGPFEDYDEFRQVVKDWHGTDIIYMATGPYNRYNYIGISKASKSRFVDHGNMADEDNKRFWLGEIVSQRVAGRKTKKHSTDLAAVEKFLIHKLQPRLNKHYKNWKPNDCISIFSRFFDKDAILEGEVHPVAGLPRFPTVIAWNSWTEDIEATAP